MNLNRMSRAVQSLQTARAVSHIGTTDTRESLTIEFLRMIADELNGEKSDMAAELLKLYS